MIEIQQNSEDKFELFIDGKLSKFKVDAEIDRKSGNYFFRIFTFDYKLLSEIENFNLENFPPLHYLNFPIKSNWFKNGFYPDIWLRSEENSRENFNKPFKVSIDFHEALTNWKADYTLRRYYNELKKVVTTREFIHLRLNDEYGLTDGFSIEQKRKIATFETISNIMNEFLDLIEKLHLKVEQNINFVDYAETIKMSFDFPSELIAHCKQYLLYFVQFLRDLGINSNSDLKEEAGKVLFSVAPIDEKTALDKIREALAVYLNLSESPIVYDDSFAAMRLKQQVDNLQHAQKMAEMEFRLATKVIESQDKIIQQKDLTIEQQSKIIEKITSKSIMIDSAENKEELEEIYDGLKIGESKFLKEQLGIHLNPAKVIKTIVKNTLGKDEKKSILNLDEKD